MCLVLFLIVPPIIIAAPNFVNTFFEKKLKFFSKSPASPLFKWEEIFKNLLPPPRFSVFSGKIKTGAQSPAPPSNRQYTDEPNIQ